MAHPGGSGRSRYDERGGVRLPRTSSASIACALCGHACRACGTAVHRDREVAACIPDSRARRAPWEDAGSSTAAALNPATITGGPATFGYPRLPHGRRLGAPALDLGGARSGRRPGSSAAIRTLLTRRNRARRVRRAPTDVTQRAAVDYSLPGEGHPATDPPVDMGPCSPATWYSGDRAARTNKQPLPLRRST